MKATLTLLTALLLAPMAVSFSMAAEPPLAPVEPSALSRLPTFSWDTVSRALFMHKPTPWADEDYAHIARHDFLQTDVNDKGMAMAREVKNFNPHLIVIGYKNLVLHIEGTADPLFRDHPEWFLFTQGKPEVNGSGRNKRPMYDLRNPAVREYWIRDVERILNMPVFDGIMFDAYAKVINYTPVKRATRQDPATEFIAGYHQMMDEHLRRSGKCGKIRIGNYLRATTEDGNVPEVMKYLDGSYLEWFDHYATLPPHLHSYEEYMAAGIQAVQRVAQRDRVIVLHLETADDKDIKVTADGQDPAAPESSRGRYKNFEYKLALFLICAERYSYFQYQGAYKVTDDFQAWAPEFPEFKKPLGPPKGPAIKNGFTYTREFQYASVSLDLTKRQGRIVWKASYPEARTLLPRHGDDQVLPGALQCKIEFDRPIKKGTGSISLHRMSDRKKLASVPVDSDAVTYRDDKTVVVTFPVSVEASTRYSITVDKGAFLDMDKMKFLGTPVLGEWQFTTR